MVCTSVVHFLSEIFSSLKSKEHVFTKKRSNDYSTEINLQVQCSKQSFKKYFTKYMYIFQKKFNIKSLTKNQIVKIQPMSDTNLQNRAIKCH